MTVAYLELGEGELIERVRRSWESMRDCHLCARECGVDRTRGELGFCRTGDRVLVASYGPHPGEEAPLRGTRGSGTIFFCGCNLGCIYCQNYETSQYMVGRQQGLRNLGRIMLRLQRKGCHNINLVSPSHVIPQILGATAWAAPRGLNLPLVYNTGGYDSLEGLRLLDGVVDIYMPDMKYQDPEVADRLSMARDYPEVNRKAVAEMHRQVGDLSLDERGIATRGLLVRHLVLPENMAGTREVVEFLAAEISENTFVNLMDQYYPAHRAWDYPPLDRRPAPGEISAALKAAAEAGLKRVYRW
ncbi:MAG: radical SAM protein [Bacillota bacterium]